MFAKLETDRRAAPATAFGCPFRVRVQQAQAGAPYCWERHSECRF